MTVFAKNKNENADKSQATQATLIMKHLCNLKKPTLSYLMKSHLGPRGREMILVFFFFFLAPPVKRVGGAILTFPF